MCIVVGQELNGKNVIVRVDRASKNKEDIDLFISKNPATWTEKMNVPGGVVNFFCERHAHEVEVEE
jgi:hypothetical protein